MTDPLVAAEVAIRAKRGPLGQHPRVVRSLLFSSNMRMNRYLISLAVVGSTAGLLACPPLDPEPRQVSSQELLESSLASLRTVVFGAERVLEGNDVSGEVATLLAPLGLIPPAVELPPAQTTFELLRDKVFTEDNREQATPTSLTLRVGPLLCPEDEAGAVDPECSAWATQVELRLELTSLWVDQVDVRVLLGAQREEVGRAKLWPQRLDFELDATAAYRILSTTANTGAAFPAELRDAILAAEVSGTVNLTASDYSAIDSRSGLNIELTGGMDLALPLDATPNAPVVRWATPVDFRVDERVTTKEVFVFTTLGPATLEAPLSAIAPQTATVGEDLGTLALALPKTRGTLVLSEDAPTVGRLEVDGAFDAHLGDHALIRAVSTGVFLGNLFEAFSFTLRRDGRGLIATSESGVHTDLDLDLDPIADAFGLPSWALSDHLTIDLDSPDLEARPPQLVIDQETGALGVIEGRLTLDSVAANRQVVVEAGECLVPIRENPDEDAHPLANLEGGRCGD